MLNTKGVRSILGVISALVIVELIGGLSGLFAGDIKGIYNGLNLPPLAPPDYLFGLVWPILYALIAIAGYLIFAQKDRGSNLYRGSILYGAQLLLNFIWSIVFFKGYFWTGTLIILGLDLLVLFCIKNFLKLNRTAGCLLIPYLLWLLFATYLSVAVAFLN